MPIAFTCPQCKKRLRAPDERAGLKVKCAGCQRILTVPASRSVPTAATGAGNAFDFSEPAPSAAPRRAPVHATGGSGAKNGRLLLFLAAGGAAVVVFIGVVAVGGWLALSAFTKKPTAPAAPTAPGGPTAQGGPPAAEEPPLTPEQEAQFTPTPLGHELRYLPDHSWQIVSIRPAQLVRTAVYRELVKSDPKAAAATVEKELSGFPVPIDPSELSRITYDYPSWWAENGVAVFTTAKPVTAEGLLARLPPGQAPEKRQVAGYSVYVSGSNPNALSGFCVPKENLVVTGSPERLSAVLARGGEPALDPPMQAALAEADFSKTRVYLNGMADGNAQTYDMSGPWQSFNPAGVLPQNTPDVTLIQVGWGGQVTARTVLFVHAARDLPRDQRDAEVHVQEYVQGPAFTEIASTMSGTTVKVENGRLVATGVMKLEHVSKFAAHGLMWR